MLPVLDARIRRNKRPRHGEGPYLVGCGVRDCPGVLATLHAHRRDVVPHVAEGLPPYFLNVTIPSGFVQREAFTTRGWQNPVHFALGTHAAKSRRHAPRRPKRLVKDGPAWSWDYAGMSASPVWVRPDGYAGSHGHGIVPLVGAGDIFITCPEAHCGRESVLHPAVVRALEVEYSADQRQAALNN